MLIRGLNPFREGLGRANHLFSPFNFLFIVATDNMNGLINKRCLISPFKKTTIFHKSGSNNN